VRDRHAFALVHGEAGHQRFLRTGGCWTLGRGGKAGATTSAMGDGTHRSVPI
jgi:hypothetical protein